MLFDYGGFPPENYQYQHNALGNPKVAARVAELLNAGGVETTFDSKRGWDHVSHVVRWMLTRTKVLP